MNRERPNPLQLLERRGQTVWLDHLARGFVLDGDLKRLIRSDSVRGVIANLSVFEKAINVSGEYDSSIAKLLTRGDRTVADLSEGIAVEDVQRAADALRPVHDGFGGTDGFVGLEVSPYLARDTKATVVEVSRLWQEVDRKNLMVTVPATAEGLLAIEELISQGLSINVTLFSSLKDYRRVVEAYLSGLERCVASGGNPSYVASVASFPVSRLDAAVDAQIDRTLERVAEAGERTRLASLKGTVAIAKAKLIYQEYKQLFGDSRWACLAAKGAKPQRLLWTSIGIEDKSYRDVLYVEELIGPSTISAMPLSTLAAFRDHGKVRDSLEEDLSTAKRALAELEESGISLDAITTTLLDSSLKQATDAADKLHGTVARKRATLLGPAINPQQLSLSDELKRTLVESTEEWRVSGRSRRLWRRDKSVWTGADEDKWLGWLNSVSSVNIADYEEFSRRVRGKRFADAVVLGVGGTCLGSEVIAQALPNKRGFPQLRFLDSIDPAQVSAMEGKIDIARTLFIVSGKSGGHPAPDILNDYFYDRVASALGTGIMPGDHFVAVTDPGSSLEEAAINRQYARIFHGEPRIGGWYSVLSPFGLVPAAAAGISLRGLIGCAHTMVRSCGAEVPPHVNPGVQLGLAMALAGLNGRDKVTILCSRRIMSFAAWAEQLLARSTGEQGNGLVPIAGEPPGDPALYDHDRFFIDLHLEGDSEVIDSERLVALERAGHPVVRINIRSVDHIGQEFFRFELAAAVAGVILR